MSFTWWNNVYTLNTSTGNCCCLGKNWWCLTYHFIFISTDINHDVPFVQLHSDMIHTYYDDVNIDIELDIEFNVGCCEGICYQRSGIKNALIRNELYEFCKLEVTNSEEGKMLNRLFFFVSKDFIASYRENFPPSGIYKHIPGT